MKKIGSLFLWVLFSYNLASAEVNVSATVHSEQISVVDTLNLQVNISSSEQLGDAEPRLSSIDGFDLLGRNVQSGSSSKLMSTPSGMKFETLYTYTYFYQLAPKIPGKFTIPPIEVVVQGKEYQTKPITINVLKADDPAVQNRPNNARPQPQDIFDQMDEMEDEIFRQMLRQRGGALNQIPDDDNSTQQNQNDTMQNPAYRNLPKTQNDAFFIQVEVDKTEVYEGEQITVNWYIYTRGLLETLDRLKFPSLRGFWKEIIEEVPSLQYTEEIINGIPYKKALLASHALFPIKAGDAYIDEFKIKSRVRVPINGMGGFFGKSYEFTKSSPRIKIKVKPLPLDNRPKNFSGAVGNFDVTAQVESTNVQVNQPFTLKVRFEGSGNAKTIDLPALSLPAELELYDTKSDSKFFKNGKSYKEFEVLIIPRSQGDLKIPELSIGAFDPYTGKYYTKTTQPIDINVSDNPNLAQKNHDRINFDSKAEKPSASGSALPSLALSYGDSMWLTVEARSIIWFSLYAFIFVFSYLQLKKIYEWGTKNKVLKEEFIERLAKIEKKVSPSNFRAVGVDLTNLMYYVINQISGKDAEGEEFYKLIEFLPPSVRRDYGQQLYKEFEHVQTLSFAPEDVLSEYKTKAHLTKKITDIKSLLSSIITASGKE